MPKKMLWTELLFSYFPIDEKKFTQQMLARFCFLFSVWLTGLLVYALDGIMMSYIVNLRIHEILFGTGFIVLFGSYMVQRSLNELIPNVRPMLKLDAPLFRKFSERVERYSYSIFPCILLALGIFLSSAPEEFQQILAEGFRLHSIWNLTFTFFVHLLSATGIWMFMSIWITIFLTSRQPLNVKLSPETIEKFRELSMLSLWFSFFYFLAISIGIVTSPAVVPAFSLLQIVISPLLFFIAIGIIGVLFPFYNIHKALLKLKQQELRKIEEESEKLLQQLDEVLAKQPTRQTSDQTVTIMARLFSLQVKERHVKSAQEWPINTSFLSKLIVLGLIPVISRIVAEIFTKYF